jgi:hypothetical protein
LQSRLIGVSEPVLLIGLGITNIGASAYVWTKIGLPVDAPQKLP